MACPDENTLVAHFDLELSADETAALFAHLDQCAACLRLFGDLVAPLASKRSQPLARTITADDSDPIATVDARRALGRYRVDRILGVGGMGVVYAAHDLELDRPVAIKLLRPDTRASIDELRARLVREAKAMARLSHPNVITVFEVGSFEQRLFIAMELVDGVTLREWLRASPRRWREVLRVLLVAGAGLQAAHEAGMVHRDFKPDNVLVARNGRICVTDFGLARLIRHPAAPSDSPSASAPLEVSVTGSGSFAGTPRYMAPEQLGGGATDARTDVFSFCVSLYEALYGELPFTGETLSELARNVAAGVIRPPGATRVPARVRRVLLWGLRVDPAARPQTMQQLLDALARVGRPRAPRLVAAAAVALVVSGGLWLARPAAPLLSGPQSRRTAALLSLANRAGTLDAGWLSPAIDEIVGAQLQAAGGPRLQPANEVARMERELDLAPTEALSRDQVRHIRDDLRVDYVVTGGYRAGPGDALELTLRLVDVATARTLAVAEERGNQSQLSDLATRAGTRLRAGLGMVALAASDRNAASALLPSLPAAARAYGQGLYYRRLNDSIGSRQAFAAAVGLEPNHAHSHFELAHALKALGFDRQAREEARRAFELTPNLERADQITIEAYYHEVTNEWDRAIELNRALVTFFPELPMYALQLAGVQSRARRGADCLATIAAIRKRSLADPQSPQIDLSEAWCADAAADFHRSQALAERAAVEADRRGARLMATRARYLAGRALDHLGHLDEALARQEKTRVAFHALGDRAGEAGALLAEGILHSEKNDQGKERAPLEQAIAIYREVGYRNGELSAINALATCVPRAEARPLFRQAATIAREIDDDLLFGAVTLNAALVDVTTGDVVAARRGLEEALAVARRIGARDMESSALGNLCPVLRRAGDAAAALTSCSAADALLQKIGEVGPLRVALSSDTALVLADRGRFADAEAMAHRATDQAHALKTASLEAISDLALASVLRQHGRLAEASRELELARALLHDQPDPELLVELATGAAHLAAASRASGAAKSARAELTTAIGDARVHGWIQRLRDARLAAGELDWLMNHDASARAELAELASEARSSGDLLNANQAAAILRR